MLSVQIIRRENRHLHADLLDRQHQVRHDIFCTELSWSGLTGRNGREYDQFDTDGTVYLVVLDGEEVVGGCRMHPSLEPTLLSDVFPQLAEVRGFARRADVLEMTRGYVVRARREGRPCVPAGAWKAAALEYCLAEGVTSFNGVWGTYLIPRLIGLGWQPRFLGLPDTLDGFDLVAANIEVTEAILARTWAYYGFSGPVTRWRGIEPKVELPSIRPALSA